MGAARRTRVRAKAGAVVVGMSLAAALTAATPAAAAESVRPDAPADPAVSPAPQNSDGEFCGWTGGVGLYPVDLSAVLRSADPDAQLTATVLLRDITVPDSPWTSYGPSLPVADGQRAVVRLGMLEDGHRYAWSVTANDGELASDQVHGCTFGVDRSAPLAPRVSSPDWPALGGGAPPGQSPGHTGVFHLAPSAGETDIVCYSHVFDDTLPPDAPCAAADASGRLSVPYTAETPGIHRLTVRARDRAGNISAADYTFNVPPPKPTEPLPLPWTTCETHDGQAICGPILEKYRLVSAHLGTARTGVQATPDGSGRYAHFAGGSVYWSPGTGAHAVGSRIRAKWAGLGWERGGLGYPTADSVTPDTGPEYAAFQHGVVFYDPQDPTAPLRALYGPLFDRFDAMYEGYDYSQAPSTDVLTTPDGIGRYAHWQTSYNFSMHWSPTTGAHTTAMSIRAKWAQLGWERGVLGYPTTDIGGMPDRRGACWSHFQHGSVFSAHCETAAFEVHGAIRNRWADLDWDRSVLGLPTTDETATPDGTGRYNHFEHGSIYWSPATGAHDIHGPIRDTWARLGWERSPLGYPVTGVTATPDGRGSYVHFQHGSIYHSPETGAREIYGAIRTTWAAQGWERGPLGYPVTGEYTPAPGHRRTDFQHGAITWNAATGRTHTTHT